MKRTSLTDVELARRQWRGRVKAALRLKRRRRRERLLGAIENRAEYYVREALCACGFSPVTNLRSLRMPDLIRVVRRMRDLEPWEQRVELGEWTGYVNALILRGMRQVDAAESTA